MSDFFDNGSIPQPVNKTASLVLSKGESYKTNKKIEQPQSKTPYPTKPIPSGHENLIGFKRGRLIVIGLAKNSKKTRWVCKCVCGHYVFRTSKAIKNIENTQDRCEECRELAYLKRQNLFDRTGINKNIRDF